MDLSQLSLDELQALRARVAPQPQAMPDLGSMSLDQLTALRDQLRGPQGGAPIKEGDWQTLADRVQTAGVQVPEGQMGPPSPDMQAQQRIAEARRQGMAYGRGRGAGETGFRQTMNTIGMGLPAYLEAATSGFGTGLSTAENHEFIKSADAARGATNPKTNMAATAAGALIQGIAAPVAPAVTAGARIAQAAKIGATTAGIQGAVESRGDPLETAKQAAIGGAAGAGAGTIAERVIAPAGRIVSDRFNALVQNPTDRAQTVLSRAYRADGQDPAAVQAFLAANPEAVLADAGGANVRSMLRGASNLSPMEGHGVIERTLTDRAGREARALQEGLEAFGGNTQSVAQRQAGVMAQAQPQTSALYREAYAAAPRIDDEALTQFAGTDIGRRAINEAMGLAQAEQAARAARGEQVAPVMFPFQRNADGVMEQVPGVGMGLEAWDYVRRAVSDMAQSAQPGSNLQRMYGDVARSLNARLDQVSPAYAQARGSAAEAFGARDAVEAGANAMRRGADPRDIQAVAARLPADQAAQFRAGQVADLQRQIMGAERVPSEGGTRSLARQIMTPDVMRRLEATPGADTAELSRVVDFWNRTADTRRAMGNSSTARQLATTAAITGAPIGYSAAQNQGAPDPRAIAISAALLGGRTYQLGREDRLGQALAQALMSRGAVPAERTLTGIPPELIAQMLVRSAGASGGAAATSYAGQR